MLVHVTHAFDLPDFGISIIQLIDDGGAGQLWLQYLSSILIDAFGFKVVFRVPDLAGLPSCEWYL